MKQHKLNLFLLLITAIFGLLLARLAHLQLIQGQKFKVLADENRFFRRQTPATRGVFLDRYQQPLVYNKKYYFRSQDADQLFAQRQAIEQEQALRLLATDSAQVSYELRRLYRYPQALAHTLGYTAPASKQDLLDNEQLQVSDWVGKIGLEKQFQNQLAGQPGYQLYEVNTMGEKQRLVRQTASLPGQNITTSLDPYLSQVAFKALGQQQGAVVILDAETGQVLSLVSKPAFDANDLSFAFIDENLEAQRQRNLQQYFQDERQVFFNRVVRGTYPPGSVFKLVTALAGLGTGAFDATTTVMDEGVLKVGEYEYANWYYTQYGRTEGELGLVRAIARSNDIFFYKAAEWTGVEALAKQARQFGFGQVTGIELPAEASGLVPDPAWKEEQFGERWYLGNTYHFGIGQGDMLVTPLQVAQLIQAVANQGEMCSPRLVTGMAAGLGQDSTSPGQGSAQAARGSIQAGQSQTRQAQVSQEQCQQLGLPEADLRLVLQGMMEACSPGGTAFPLFKYARQAGWQDPAEVRQQLEAGAVAKQDIDTWLQQGAVACKTGTAEFGGVDEQGYRQTHAWLGAVVGVDVAQLQAEARKAQDQDVEASADLRQTWLRQFATVAGRVSEPSDPDKAEVETEMQTEMPGANRGLPRRLVIVALVESDEQQPYKEGSEHAAPVVAEIIDWIRGEGDRES